MTHREMCRDELLALLREASSQGQSLGKQQPPQLSGGTCPQELCALNPAKRRETNQGV